jgi:hypothetical protein
MTVSPCLPRPKEERPSRKRSFDYGLVGRLPSDYRETP